MNPSNSKLNSLPPQQSINIKKSNSLKQKEKLFDFIDVNLDKKFLNKYFQESKKK